MQRRDILQLTLALGAGVIVRPALATSSEMQAAIRGYTHGAPVSVGKVLLDVSPLVENGNAVPITVSVQSPMTAAEHVSGIAVFNDRNPQRGEVIELRDLITRFSCRYNNELVFSAELYPAVAANPYLAFSTVATESGTLSFTWEGDNGFAQTETVAIT